MRIFVLTAVVLTWVACGPGPSAPSVPLNERFTLARGEGATVADTSLRLRFVDVRNDSRCPADAICIQGGDAVVHVRAFDGRTVQSYDLHTGDSSRARVTLGPATLELVELQPYPFASRPTRPDDYRATFVVRR